MRDHESLRFRKALTLIFTEYFTCAVVSVFILATENTAPIKLSCPAENRMVCMGKLIL